MEGRGGGGVLARARKKAGMTTRHDHHHTFKLGGTCPAGRQILCTEDPPCLTKRSTKSFRNWFTRRHWHIVFGVWHPPGCPDSKQGRPQLPTPRTKHWCQQASAIGSVRGDGRGTHWNLYMSLVEKEFRRSASTVWPPSLAPYFPASLLPPFSLRSKHTFDSTTNSAKVFTFRSSTSSTSVGSNPM